MADNIATLAIKVNANISGAKAGLHQLLREVDKVNKGIANTNFSQWGIIRGAQKGAFYGRKFGNDLVRSASVALNTGKSLTDYLFGNKNTTSKAKEQLKTMAGVLAGVAVGGRIGNNTGLSYLIRGLQGLKSTGVLTTLKNTLAYIRNTPRPKMADDLYNASRRFVPRLRQLSFGKYNLGRPIGDRMTDYAERGYNKLFRTFSPIGNIANKSQAHLQRLFSPNMAAHIEQVASTPAFLNNMTWSGQLKSLIAGVQKKRNVGPNSKAGMKIESELRKKLQPEEFNIWERIKDTPLALFGRAFKRNAIPDLIGGIKSKASSVGDWFTKPRTRTIQTNPYMGVDGLKEVQQSRLGQVGRSVAGVPGGIAGGTLKAVSYLPSAFGRVYKAGKFAFEGVYEVASSIPSKLMSVFNTLNPFEMFTRSLLAFKTTAVMALGAVGIASIKLSGEFEQFRIGFSALTGSEEVGNRTFAEMTKFASKTPFSIKEVMAASQMLLGYGTKAEQLYPTLKMIGDVTSAIGNDYINLQHVTYLFGTMQQQGHVFTRDVNQLANIGIPIYEELANVLKVNKQEITGMVEAGKVGFPEMQQAFLNMTRNGSRFGGFMEKQSKSLLGMWRNFKDNLEIAGSKLGDKLVKDFELKGLLADLTAKTNNIDEMFFKYKPEIDSIISLIKSGVGYAQSIGHHIGAGFRVAFDIANQLFPKTFTVLERIAKGGVDIKTSWSSAKDTLTDVFEGIALTVAKMMDMIRNGLYDIINEYNSLTDPIGRKDLSKTDTVDRHLGDRFTNLKDQADATAKRVDYYKGRVNGGLNGEEDTKGLKDSQARLDTLNRLIEFQRSEMKKSLLSRNDGYYEHKDTGSTFTADVNAFFSTFRKNQVESIKLEERRMDVYRDSGPKAVTDMLIGGFGPAMRSPEYKAMAYNNLMKDEHLDKLSGRQVNAVGLIGGGAAVAGANALLRDMSRKSDARFNNPTGLPLNPSDDPEKRQLDLAKNLLSKEQQDLLSSLRNEKTPVEELKDTVKNLDYMSKVGVIDSTTHAKGLFKAYSKAEKDLGLNEVHLAPAALQGSSEAMSIENKIRSGVYNRTDPMQAMDATMKEALEVEKQQRDLLQTISRSLDTKDMKGGVLDIFDRFRGLGPGG